MTASVCLRSHLCFRGTHTAPSNERSPRGPSNTQPGHWGQAAVQRVPQALSVAALGCHACISTTAFGTGASARMRQCTWAAQGQCLIRTGPQHRALDPACCAVPCQGSDAWDARSLYSRYQQHSMTGLVPVIEAGPQDTDGSQRVQMQRLLPGAVCLGRLAFSCNVSTHS